MTISVSPIRTVGDNTPYEWRWLTITSKVAQIVRVYEDATLVAEYPATANFPTRVSLPTAPPEGYYDLRVVGSTVGEWRGRSALTGVSFVVSFVDEKGNPITDLNVFYFNLDEPSLFNPKMDKQASVRKYTLAGRWVAEVGKKEPDSTFRYAIIDLTTITSDTTITLPKLKEAMIAIKFDLGLMWDLIIRGLGAVDYVVGMVASALGFRDYPSLATGLIHQVFNVLPKPPHAWELKDNILTIYYKVTPEFFAIAPLVAGLIIIAIIGTVLTVGLISYGVVKVAEADKARSEAQAKIVEEHTSAIDKWLAYAKAEGLTAQETVRGVEAIGSSYGQMSQNLQPFPFPWGVIIPIIVMVIVVAVILAIIRG